METRHIKIAGRGEEREMTITVYAHRGDECRSDCTRTRWITAYSDGIRIAGVSAKGWTGVRKIVLRVRMSPRAETSYTKRDLYDLAESVLAYKRPHAERRTK